MKIRTTKKRASRGRICMAAVGNALTGYVDLLSARRMLEHWERLPAVTTLVQEKLKSFLDSKVHEKAVQGAGKEISKTAHTLCQINARRMVSSLRSALRHLKQGSVPEAIRDLEKAGSQSSRCGSTIVEFCAPISTKRRKELADYAKEQGKK